MSTDAGDEGVRPAVMRARESGYDVSICACDAGPYIGARKSGTPCCCEVCGFVTQEQYDHLLAAAEARLGEGVVEWGVRWSAPPIDWFSTESAARHMAGDVGTLVTRTVHTSPWVEVSE